MEEIREVNIEITVKTNKDTYSVKTDSMDEAVDFYYEKMYGVVGNGNDPELEPK